MIGDEPFQGPYPAMQLLRIQWETREWARRVRDGR